MNIFQVDFQGSFYDLAGQTSQYGHFNDLLINTSDCNVLKSLYYEDLIILIFVTSEQRIRPLYWQTDRNLCQSTIGIHSLEQLRNRLAEASSSPPYSAYWSRLLIELFYCNCIQCFSIVFLEKLHILDTLCIYSTSILSIYVKIYSQKDYRY